MASICTKKILKLTESIMRNIKNIYKSKTWREIKITQTRKKHQDVRPSVAKSNCSNHGWLNGVGYKGRAVAMLKTSGQSKVLQRRKGRNIWLTWTYFKT